VTHGLCEFLDGVYVLCSCPEHKVLLTDNGKEEGGEEGGIERVNGVCGVFVEQPEIVCAARVWDSGVSGMVHDLSVRSGSASSRLG
jgi:hypothetical protein